MARHQRTERRPIRIGYLYTTGKGWRGEVWMTDTGRTVYTSPHYPERWMAESAANEYVRDIFGRPAPAEYN
jgi:hypothetical protein